MTRLRSLPTARAHSRAVSEGIRFRTPRLTMFVAPGQSRLGMAVRAPTAVIRNRARRRVRSAFVAAGGPTSNRDVVVRGDDRLAAVKFQQLVDDMRAGLEAAP